MKRVIIDIGYRYYLAPENVDIGSVLNVFSDFIEVEKEYYDGKDFYHSSGKNKNKEVEIKLVPAENIRDLTPEEKENKEIKDLKSSVSYRDGQIEKKDKEIEDLKCKVALLMAQTKEPLVPE